MDLIIRVAEIQGKCPVYNIGDNFIIAEGYKLIAAKPVCMHSLVSLMPYYVALSKGINPVKLGLTKDKGKDKDKAYLQCLDPYTKTGGGTVVFEVSRSNAKSDVC